MSFFSVALGLAPGLLVADHDLLGIVVDLDQNQSLDQEADLVVVPVLHLTREDADLDQGRIHHAEDRAHPRDLDLHAEEDILQDDIHDQDHDRLEELIGKKFI